MDFSLDDIEVLIEALGEWESSDTQSSFMTGILGMMLSGKENREQEKDEFTSKMKEAAEKTKLKKETSTILKAKLFQIKREMAIGKLNKV